jgi:hypothetical protein
LAGDAQAVLHTVVHDQHLAFAIEQVTACDDSGATNLAIGGRRIGGGVRK